MSQVVGLNFKSKIPTLGDDASIQEALRVYHYGVDNYSSQPIPVDSIEGNFTAIDGRVTSIETTLSTFGNSFVRLISPSSSPNIITAQSITTIPLTIKAIASQTSVLQAWQTSSGTNIASISTGGAFGISGYSSIGSTTVSATIASSINIIGSSHKGITVKSAASQSANLQEWQDQSGSPITIIDKDGEIVSNKNIYAKNGEVQTMNPFLLMGS